MNKRNTLRKGIFIVLAFSAMLNVLTLFVWKLAYLNPKEKEFLEQKELIRLEFLNQEYDNYEDLIVKLDSISNISYSVESEEHAIKEGGKYQDDDKVILSELIEIENKNYLLKIYSNTTFGVSEFVVSILKVHAAVTILVTIAIGFMIHQLVLKPLTNLIFEMKNYKFGKKPKKNKKVKNEIDIIQNEFVELTNALDEEKNEQHRIIASISHDLKTPLTSVIGYSNLMLNKNMTKEQLIKYNEKINSKSKNMKDILNNFDEYLINNTQVLKTETIKIKDLLEQLEEDYRFDLKSANIDFIVESNCDEEYIQIDIKKIRRVFANIIDNSVRYIKINGIIKIKVLEDEEIYKFIISDNGKGVDENIIHKIFNPLFTTDNSRKISGLGLSICKDFIELHGGNIMAYNNLGLTVEFTIPKEQSKHKK